MEVLSARSWQKLWKDFKGRLRGPDPGPHQFTSPGLSLGPHKAAGQDLNMDGCKKVPGAAWQLLAQAQWEKLTKASFRWRLGKRGRLERVALEVEADGGEGVGNGGRLRCFEESGEGAAALLSVLGGCRQLEDSAEFARLL